MFEGLLEQFASGSIMVTIYFMLFLFLAVVGGIVGFIIYKGTFKVKVNIYTLKESGIALKTGLKGKFYIRGKANNHKRFKIWGAKRHKLLYNEENITEDFIYLAEENGKLVQTINFAPDSEGFLTPLKIKPRMYEENVLDAEGNVEKVIKTTVLTSEYGIQDVAWNQSENEKWLDLFGNRDKTLQWILIVLCIVAAVAIACVLYIIYKTGQHQAVITESSQVLAESCFLLIQNATGVAPGSGPFITTIIQ